MIRAVLAAAPAAALAAGLAVAPAIAQAQQVQASAQAGITVASLLADGYSIVAASSDGSSQFLYLQSTDAAKHKTAYACQIQFGANGGFRGCLVLP